MVVFTSYASNLDPADANEREDVYARDLETGQITLLSRDPAGAPGEALPLVLRARGMLIVTAAAVVPVE